MVIQELKKILEGQAYIFQETYFESPQIHLLTTMYCFEHTNHDILLIFDFLAKSLHMLATCISNIFHI